MVSMAVVVLGCKSPNNVPSSMMMRRVSLGVHVFNDLRREALSLDCSFTLILSGSGQTLGEAAVMKRLATENGVDEQNIVLEEEARNTVENAYFAKLIIDELDVREIHVVSSDFHIPRCKIIFGTFYHEPCYTVQYHGAGEEMTEERRKKEEDEKSTVYENIHRCIIDHGSREKPLIFKSDVLSIDGFVHGFTSRVGGVSRCKPLASLNLKFKPTGPDPEVFIRENYRRVAAAMGFDVETAQNPQIGHGRVIWVIGDPQPGSYDGIVTNQPGIAITAPGADCMPVLMCDPVHNVIAAIHSGWSGTLHQIASHAIEIMVERFTCNPRDIRAAVGPSIGPCCFEVESDFAEMFEDAFVIKEPQWSRPHVDLWGCLYVTLEKCGVLPQNMDIPLPFKGRDRHGYLSSPVTTCTACNPDKLFFSWARDGHPHGCGLGIILMRNSTTRILKSPL